MKRKTLEYEEKRRAMQQELGSIRDFVAGFSLNDFEIARFSELFRSYRRTDGQKKAGFEAVDTVLDFLCGYGVQFISVLLGAILVARGSLSEGRAGESEAYVDFLWSVGGGRQRQRRCL